jgi:NAD(P)-dependent dehydrogenase (short-subunit alcohol dehydrogenase family)
VLVTGSTGGIGRDMAQRFAQAGAAVVITGRTVSRGREVKAMVRAAGGRALYVPLDIAEEDQVETPGTGPGQPSGRLTGFANNAATIQGRGGRPLTEIETDEWLI